MNKTLSVEQVNVGQDNQKDNEELARKVLQAIIDRGVTDICMCPGSRNSPFMPFFHQSNEINVHYWFEERSAAFFALGCSRRQQRPAAVIVSSGTAAGELLPAAMEAYYTGVPLLLITADRPRRFRKSGAPQAAEHVGLFSCYAPFQLDIAANEECDLSGWDMKSPAHLNICMEEPARKFEMRGDLLKYNSMIEFAPMKECKNERLEIQNFLEEVDYPFIVVSALKPQAKEGVVEFLLNLNAPVFLEGTSGIREDARLQHLRVHRTENIWKHAVDAHYPIDSILRIGGVPTFRLWRELEEREGKIKVCNVSEDPFSGLSWAGVLTASLQKLFEEKFVCKKFSGFENWISREKNFSMHLRDLFLEESQAEPSLVYGLSQHIPFRSTVYLGNSLPIREWNLAAANVERQFSVQASRGVCGIDGQIATFLGLCSSSTSNWAIIGDLTALYDMAAPWILTHLDDIQVNIVIINNGGGKIFERMYEDKAIQNLHHISFEPLARLWNLHYEKWKDIPAKVLCHHNQLIEIVPNEEATNRFWKKFNAL